MQGSLSPERILEMTFAMAPPLILEAAIHHRVFDVLDEGPRTLDDLVDATKTSPRGMRLLLDALAGLALVAKEAGKYQLTPESAAFLVSTKPGFQGGLFRHVSRQLLPHWMRLTEIVKTGRPACAVNVEETGAPFFRDFVEDLFARGYAAARTLADHLQVANVTAPTRVLDIAAGSAVWSIALAERSPRVAVTVVDWSEVIPVAQKMTARLNVRDQYQFIAGDLLQVEYGTGFHIATLGHILHSEGAERSQKLLKKVSAALVSGGTIVIAEMVPDEDRAGPPHAVIFGVNMLVHTEVGDVFTFQEMRAWLHDAGFTDVRQLPAPAPSPLILATKA